MTKIEGEHTATPWGYVYDGSSEWSIGPADDPQSNPVMTVWSKDDDKAKANCAFIVKACNAHDDLVKILKECRASFVSHEDNFDIGDGGMVKQIDQAISRAEGEASPSKGE